MNYRKLRKRMSQIMLGDFGPIMQGQTQTRVLSALSRPGADRDWWERVMLAFSGFAGVSYAQAVHAIATGNGFALRGVAVRRLAEVRAEISAMPAKLGIEALRRKAKLMKERNRLSKAVNMNPVDFVASTRSDFSRALAVSHREEG